MFFKEQSLNRKGTSPDPGLPVSGWNRKMDECISLCHAVKQAGRGTIRN